MSETAGENLARKQEWTWLGVGATFLVAGVVMFLSESTRMAGLPFLVLGLVFFSTGADNRRKRTAPKPKPGAPGGPKPGQEGPTDAV